MCSAQKLNPINHVKSVIRNPLNPLAADPITAKVQEKVAPFDPLQRSGGMLGKVSRLTLSRRA